MQAVASKKKTLNGVLENEDLKQNGKLSCDVIILENYFRRLCQL